MSPVTSITKVTMPLRANKAIYILNAGSTLTELRETRGDFHDWIRVGLLSGLAPGSCQPPIEVVNVRSKALNLAQWPAADACLAVVITGSHDMVTDRAPWMVEAGCWLQNITSAGVPTLGICFGHQLLASSLGGQVGTHPKGLELGTVKVHIGAKVANDPVWQGMPSTFDAHAVHYQTVLKLPTESVALASNAHEQHHAFRWRHHVWGVQFHPEFDPQIMQAYVQHVTSTNTRDNVTQVKAKSVRITDTPYATLLLSNFARHAVHLGLSPN